MNNYDENNNLNKDSGSDKVEQNNNVGSSNEAEKSGASYSYRSGEYSYSSKDNIPDQRYVYSSGGSYYAPGYEAAKSDKKKKKSGPRGWVIALVVVSAVVLSAFAGFGGALLAERLFDDSEDIPPIEDNTPDDDLSIELPSNNGGEQEIPSGDNDNDSVIIVKDNVITNVETVSGNIGDEDLELTEVVTLVKDSVVEIFTEVSVYNGRYVQSGAGSGVIIGTSSDGKDAYVVTNNHVIEDADTITVRLANGNEYTATLRGTDATSDLAVLKMKVDESVTVAQIGCSANLKVGEDVVVIGNPLGELGGSVTDGIISALARALDVDGVTMTLLQTNAAVNPGNSGGGLFNMKGQLVGIVNAKTSGSDIDNIGFAIPSDTAYEIIHELITYGYVTGRVDAGLTLIDITDTYTAWYYGVSSLGVYVYDSKYSEDIKSGDRIVAVNGVEVATAGDINGQLSGLSVGDTVVFRISRKGKQYDVSMTLREYVPSGVGENVEAQENKN